MVYQLTSEEAAEHSTDEDILASDLASMAMAGGAFDWLADEPDLYDDTHGEPIETVLPLGKSAGTGI